MVDIILKNGFVYTMNDKAPVAEAVAVEGQKIRAVGTTEEIMALKEDQTKVIDLEGKMLLPGFIDAHCHPAMCAFFANGVLIDEDMNIPEVEATIEAYIKENPDKNAYFGIGYNEFLYDEKGPKKEDLDKFCKDKPVVILGSGGHEGWCNTKALELAGVDKNTPDPIPGFQYFERDADGNPTGHLVETAPESIVFDAAEYFERDVVRKNFIDVSKSYSEMGVTSLVTCGDLRWMQKISMPEPLNSIEVACTRKMIGVTDAPVLSPADQKLTVHQCLEGYTTNAAYQMRMEDKLGTIEAGKYADMVVLAENILEIPLETIHDVSVEMTIADGKIVFEK